MWLRWVSPLCSYPSTLHPHSSRSVHLEADLEGWAPQAPLPCFYPLLSACPLAGWRWVAGRRDSKAGTFISRIGLICRPCVGCVTLNQAETPARQTSPLGGLLVIAPALDLRPKRDVLDPTLCRDPWYCTTVLRLP